MKMKFRIKNVIALCIALITIVSCSKKSDSTSSPNNNNVNNTSSWKSLGGGMNGNVFVLDSSNGNLYAGGLFTTAGGNSANYVAVWNGVSWSSLGAGLSNGSGYTGVYAMTNYNGNLVVAGRFRKAGGVSANNIALWNGSSWSALGKGLAGAGISVSALAVYNGNLYAGGIFDSAGGNLVNGIAEWNGVNWNSVGGGVTGGSISLFSGIASLVVYQGNLYAGGSFSFAGINPVSNIAYWNGSTWSALKAGITGSGNYDPVETMAILGGNLYVGGSFTNAGGNVTNNIAYWNGSQWTGLQNGTASNDIYSGLINTMKVFSNTLYLGGHFTSSGGSSANGIATYNGTSWGTLGSGVSGNNPYVLSLDVYNSNIYIGGSFTSPGNYVAEW